MFKKDEISWNLKTGALDSESRSPRPWHREFVLYFPSPGSRATAHALPGSLPENSMKQSSDEPILQLFAKW